MSAYEGIDDVDGSAMAWSRRRPLIKEKVLAAHRAGVRTLILPRRKEKTLLRPGVSQVSGM